MPDSMSIKSIGALERFGSHEVLRCFYTSEKLKLGNALFWKNFEPINCYPTSIATCLDLLEKSGLSRIVCEL